MSHAVNPVPRRILAPLCLAWLATGAAAQDLNATTVQAAARDWLALTDRGDAVASWDAAGKKFQSALPVASWAAALEGERAPLGPASSRAIVKTSFRRTFPGASEGDYALVVFATSFASKPLVYETLTLERGVDGTWRVIGYDIH